MAFQVGNLELSNIVSPGRDLRELKWVEWMELVSGSGKVGDGLSEWGFVVKCGDNEEWEEGCWWEWWIWAGGAIA